MNVVAHIFNGVVKLLDASIDEQLFEDASRVMLNTVSGRAAEKIDAVIDSGIFKRCVQHLQLHHMSERDTPKRVLQCIDVVAIMGTESQQQRMLDAELLPVFRSLLANPNMVQKAVSTLSNMMIAKSLLEPSSPPNTCRWRKYAGVEPTE